jgi:serine/threonine-protein kinase RIM15
MEKLLEKLRCRTAIAQTGPEAIRYATSEVKFDIIMMEYRLPQINGADVARMIRKTKNANSTTPIVAVTGYLKELPPDHYFDGLIEKPPTVLKLTEIMTRLCQWRPPPPHGAPSPYAQLPPLSHLRQESLRTEDSPTSNSSSFGAQNPPGSYRGSSREDSISSSFFGDMDVRTDDPSVAFSKQSTEDWHDRELSQAFDGLGISEDPPDDEPKEAGNLQPYPGSLEPSVPRKKISTEWIGMKKKRSEEEKRRGSAESGDDEDEELGDVQVRARSPRARPRGTSKLATEMLRTNSHGSVVSVEDGSILSSLDALPSSPPPAIAEDPGYEDCEQEMDQAVPALGTPPEIFDKEPGNEVRTFVEEDANLTPKPLAAHTDIVDFDPTPRPASRSANALGKGMGAQK